MLFVLFCSFAVFGCLFVVLFVCLLFLMQTNEKVNVLIILNLRNIRNFKVIAYIFGEIVYIYAMCITESSVRRFALYIPDVLGHFGPTSYFSFM